MTTRRDSGGGASIGVGILRLARGFLAADSLASAALPILQEFTALSGEACGLCIRQGFDRILVQQVESPHPLRHHAPIGERLPLHVGASGHVLCAGTEVLAAINITGPSGRLFAEQMNELAPEVTRAVREISQKRALLWMGLA